MSQVLRLCLHGSALRNGIGTPHKSRALDIFRGDKLPGRIKVYSWIAPAHWFQCVRREVSPLMVSNEAGWLSLSPTVKYIFFVQPVMRRHVPVSPGKRNGTGYTAFKGVPLSSAHQHNVVY